MITLGLEPTPHSLWLAALYSRYSARIELLGVLSSVAGSARPRWRGMGPALTFRQSLQQSIRQIQRLDDSQLR